ncbi:DNA polymerase-4 [Litorimonas taeanensis]|uniref:DNA polymerase IV n=1 Tax=Litorimonas taeanensis TaxID=568099 RepID=A0A420WL58_9PROT|nr:DNA polymerase IV [Litorimonas taeanensis]RKQ71758.1 DNA polymerase-4 [Litorimonas taeanensis]
MSSHFDINLPSSLISLCRDCGAGSTDLLSRCPKCESGRIISHSELGHLSIAHVDCDAFYCSVEKRDNPEIRDKPVIVGGGQRGVVSAACYHARIYGVRSAMPMFKALKLCPDAVVVRGSMEKYAYEGRRIRDMMKALTPLVEPLSIDEAFLDLSGTQRLHGLTPVESLMKLQSRILKDVGVTVSVGLSYNKFLAKTASDLDKPHGFAVLGRSDAQTFLLDKPVGFIFGIGPAFAAKLMKGGLHTIADVRKISDKEMAKRFGEPGLRLARLARAEDFRKVKPRAERKSVSAETTFNTDISDKDDLKDKLWQVCLKTADRAKAKNLAGRTVTLKLKTSRFKSITRRRTLAQPVQLADTIFRALEPLLEAELKGSSYRLIGAGISSLSAPIGDSADLLDPQASKRGQAERASDIAREKFGRDAIVTGRGFRLNQARNKQTSEATSLPTKINPQDIESHTPPKKTP